MKLSFSCQPVPREWIICALLSGISGLPLEAQQALNFVPMAPCRIVDTRDPNGTFGGPIIRGQSSRDFPIPQSKCSVPAFATGYSLNVTVVPAGPLGYLTIWPTGQAQPSVSTLNAPLGQVTANAALIGAGSNGGISVFVSNDAHVILDINGYFVAPPAPSATTQNTSVGSGALGVNDSGVGNTAIGFAVLANNTVGNNNFGSGSSALNQNTTGSANTAVGSQSLWNNFTGNDNTALGYFAAWGNTTGLENVAVGANSLAAGSIGSGNTAGGTNALTNQTIGSCNIGIGYNAGSNLGTGSNNIFIGNTGQTNDTKVIRIGSANQTDTYVSGIFGRPLGSGPLQVLVDSNGKLGTLVSSERFKEEIESIGEESRGLLSLRPVSFYYKDGAQSGPRTLQYGLIAEQVAQVYPNLAVYGGDGKPLSVQYQQIPILMLNEMQKQQKTIEQQAQAIKNGNERIRALEEQVTAVTSVVHELQAQH